ncbi:hypothetical protein HOP50_02g15440 [Chloropicon primus]|uniref:FAD-binding domain-containing protein n=2 Tax=Chloropicon primus TaxID=1764295 RepID=A0A5B8MH52_9CHLO|nr:hypothetical protein A3770_02p15530 [Chloropicon primus]UPQ98244.1 hypothetical protein HOP50_02g15440 [Chloropicon primus]|eukprot:QDZ19035.1 hypothetical protein A3770_02p15530 [Chloropicon primus]
MAGKTMRVGISGGGPAGLTLAAILSREASEGAFKVTVFERGEEDRDQGSGWDMNQAAKDALSRAGVDPASVQRAGSDTMRIFKVAESGQQELTACLRMPGVLSRLGLRKEMIGLNELGQETERTKIISYLLGQLGEDVVVKHECPVTGARRVTGQGVEVLGRNGASLGIFDAVVDASGTASALRRCRYQPEADAFYTGTVFLQGEVDSPEKEWDAKIVQRLGEGTYGFCGPSEDGKGVVDGWAQRYGALKEDQMTNVTVRLGAKDFHELSRAVGLEGVHGISHEKSHVASVRKFLAKKFSHGAWDQAHLGLFASIKGVRFLPIFMHPLAEVARANVVPGSDSLPLVGIGDALHALPPWSGTSGNFALSDASDLATALLEEQKKASWSIASTLRAKENEFLDRADGPRQRCIDSNKYTVEHSATTPIADFDFISSHILGGKKWYQSVEGFFVTAFIRGLTALNWWDNYGLR